MRPFRSALSSACLAAAIVGIPATAIAQGALASEQGGPASIAKSMAPLEPLGQSSLYVSVFHVYDAELWAPSTGFSWDDPFRLKLTYARKIKADQLVNASLKEMARVFGGKSRDYEGFRAPLAACFRDVKKGDVIEGVSQNRDVAQFFFNGKETCRLNLPEASYKFFSIWLSERSRSPKQARRLLGQ